MDDVLPGGGDCELSFEEKAQVGETNTVLVGVQGGILSRRACRARSPEMEAVLGTQTALLGRILGHSSTRGLRPPEQLERPAGFPSSALGALFA